ALAGLGRHSVSPRAVAPDPVLVGLIVIRSTRNRVTLQTRAVVAAIVGWVERSEAHRTAAEAACGPRKAPPPPPVPLSTPPRPDARAPGEAVDALIPAFLDREPGGSHRHGRGQHDHDQGREEPARPAARPGEGFVLTGERRYPARPDQAADRNCQAAGCDHQP